MCVDAGAKDIRDLLTKSDELDSGTPEQVLARHSKLLYQLLEHGRHAAADLKPEFRRLLGDKYSDSLKDPWGREFVFYLRKSAGAKPPELQGKLLSAYTTGNLPTLSSDFIRAQPDALPFAFIISTGKDGELAGLSTQPRRSLYRYGEILPMGDDITNLTAVGSMAE